MGHPTTQEDLKEIAEEGQIFEIKSRAKAIGDLDETYLPFANHLQTLSNSMDMAEIERFIKSYLEKSE